MTTTIDTSRVWPSSRAACAVVPVYGVALGTRIRTTDGDIPVEYLTPGDRLLTGDMGAFTLRGLTAAVLPEADMVCIGQGALGHDRPDRTLAIPACQSILVTGWRGGALFGRQPALVPAAKLVDGQNVRRETRAATRIFTLHFERPHLIWADGVMLVSGPGFQPR